MRLIQVTFLASTIARGTQSDTDQFPDIHSYGKLLLGNRGQSVH